MDPTAERRRQHLVAELLQLGCVRTQSVANAFAEVARERFVPSTTPLDRVYGLDEAVPTRFDDAGVPISSSSAPRIMAVMLEMLEAEHGQRVLEVGAGTGYNAALLARVVGPNGSITSIDIDAAVAFEAIDHLASTGVTSVSVMAGDGWWGRPGQTFDRVIATAECWDISPAWVEQLSEGGILVLPLWVRPGLTLAVAFEKTDTFLKSRSVAYCGFMPLRGPHASPPLRTPVPTVPWDKRVDSDQHRWLAFFDEATADRVALVVNLLNEPGSVHSAPPSFVGWNVRLAIEESGPICFTTMLPPLRYALGLFDGNRQGLAVLHGDSIYSYGQPTCRDRLLTFLSTSQPLDISDLTILVVPHGTAIAPTDSVCISRPNFDLWIHPSGNVGSSLGP
jgi:protein-L-isoaspartate(D-aspartate) O-methyltransferase